jgi:uncharacterized protein (DUF58 family)
VLFSRHSEPEPVTDSPRLLRTVHRRLRLPARTRARGLLTGEHRSVHKGGRSLEFEDLRHYERGDDVRDVDWKATARTGAVLMRRHVAERKQQLLVVIDTGIEMSARSAGGAPKRELALLAAGFVGSVAVQAGDLVGLLAGDSAGRTRAPMRHQRAHLELMLRRLDGRLRAGQGHTDLAGLLDDARRHTVRRSIVLVVSDDGPFTDEVAESLRRLRLRHDVLWLSVRDAVLMDDELAGVDLIDVVARSRLPAVVRDDPDLRAAYESSTRSAAEHRRATLRRLGIAAEDISAEADVVPAVIRLLERAGRA